jgi:hypothetical protein
VDLFRTTSIARDPPIETVKDRLRLPKRAAERVDQIVREMQTDFGRCPSARGRLLTAINDVNFRGFRKDGFRQP